jgi:predicted kinase
MKEAPSSSETSVLRRATRRNIPEDVILHKLRVFENMNAEKNICTEEGWSDGRMEELYNVEVRDLYTSPNIIRIITSRRVRWVGM